MKKTLLAALAAILVGVPSAHAGSITVAAASDLKFAMDEIVDRFKTANPGEEVSVVYGSSGKFQTQIQQGAPFDLYFSADITLAQQLVKAGFAASEARPYAFGRIVLWSNSLDASKLTLASLTDDKIRHIAIANPKHAPYGQRAEQALRKAGVWDKVVSKIVYGENIAQTARFVQTGSAEVGIIALSLALNEELASAGGYWLISDSMHAPLEQGFVITARAKDNALAERFAHHMTGPAARAIMTKYGFVLPGDERTAKPKK